MTDTASNPARPAKISMRNITLSIGGITALKDGSVDIRENEILAIIGPNGAGKTCLLNSLNGFYKPQKGEINFEGKNITRIRPDKAARMGLARTFQNIQLFSVLTTLESAMAARHVFMKQNLLTGGLYYGPAHGEEIRHRRVVEDIIDFMEIESVRHHVVAFLPYGMRKRIELARALALEPRVLLLDEQMAGMNTEEKEDIARFIVDIFEGQGECYPESPVLRDGVNTIVLIEHDMGVVMDLADRIVVLDFGRKIAEGTPEEIRNNPQVIAAYLGESAKR